MRSSFDSSRLVRLVGDWAPAEVEAAGMDFAERMSLWFGAFDTLRLQAAQQSLRALQAAAPGRAKGAEALAEEFQRVRAALAAAIAQRPVAVGKPGKEPGYAPYRERHLELQRQMELMIGPLREQVRQALSQASAGLRQLAALDAALEGVLAPRAQRLLPALPALIERRFEQLRPAGQPEDFERDWRQALLAELDLRLEPVAGLIDALSNQPDLKE